MKQYFLNVIRNNVDAIKLNDFISMLYYRNNENKYKNLLEVKQKLLFIRLYYIQQSYMRLRDYK